MVKKRSTHCKKHSKIAQNVTLKTANLIRKLLSLWFCSVTSTESHRV